MSTMLNLEEELQKIESKLDKLLDRLVSGLNLIHCLGVPDAADKIVIWIPLGHRNSLNFTYMTNDASEIVGDYWHLSTLDDELNELLDNCDDFDSVDLNKLSRSTEELVAKWLKRGLNMSSFQEVKLHKVMAINNVCAYFDLETLELLEDDEMWS